MQRRYVTQVALAESIQEAKKEVSVVEENVEESTTAAPFRHDLAVEYHSALAKAYAASGFKRAAMQHSKMAKFHQEAAKKAVDVTSQGTTRVG